MKYKVIVKEIYFDEFELEADSDRIAINDATQLWEKQHPDGKTTGLAEVQLLIEKGSQYVAMTGKQSADSDWEEV